MARVFFAVLDIADSRRKLLGMWIVMPEPMPAGSRFAFVNTGATDAESRLVVRGEAPKRPQFSAELVPGEIAGLSAQGECGVMAGAGHLFPWLQPQWAAQQITRFLSHRSGA